MYATLLLDNGGHTRSVPGRCNRPTGRTMPACLKPSSAFGVTATARAASASLEQYRTKIQEEAGLVELAQWLMTAKVSAGKGAGTGLPWRLEGTGQLTAETHLNCESLITLRLVPSRFSAAPWPGPSPTNATGP